jgi:hypothetical protein
MPKAIVNKFRAPKPFLDYASQSHYDKGDAQYSVTTLIDSPQVAVLSERFPDDESVDPFESKTLWSLIGTAIHHILEVCPEREDEWDRTTFCQKEERITTEYKGYKLTGGIDLQTICGSDVVIGDFKYTTVYSARSQDQRQKWERQLNLYRWLVAREKNLSIKGLEVYAILRDWRPSMVDKYPDYPKSPGWTIDIPIWSWSKVESYVDDRLQAHLEAEELTEMDGYFGSNEGCSNEERWYSPAIYKVIKKGGKRAVPRGANLSREAAEEKCAELGADYYNVVLAKPSTFRRCEGNYCGVAQRCAQWNFE